MDTSTANRAGVVGTYTAVNMCQDKVFACAALYSGADATECKIENGKFANANECGLSALLSYMDAITDIRVADGCESALKSFAEGLCTPTNGEMGYPWNCRTKMIGTLPDSTGLNMTTNVAGANNPEKGSPSLQASLAENLVDYAINNCMDPTLKDSERKYSALPAQVKMVMERTLSDISDRLETQLSEQCEAMDGYWVYPDESEENLRTLSSFYSKTFGRANGGDTSLGMCVENTTLVRCTAFNSGDTVYAEYDAQKDECVFTDEWYKLRCSFLGDGYYEGGVCYIKK